VVLAGGGTLLSDLVCESFSELVSGVGAVPDADDTAEAASFVEAGGVSAPCCTGVIAGKF
jgi:hypothetical protein